MIAYALGKHMSSHLKVASNECAAKEFALHKVLPCFCNKDIQTGNFTLNETCQVEEKCIIVLNV